MRLMRIVATAAALSMAAVSMPATAQAGHYYGHGYKAYHGKSVFVPKHRRAFVPRHRGVFVHKRRSRGDALAAGIFGLAAGAIIGSALAQPRYAAPRHVAPTYAAPIYGAPPVGSPEWYSYCASKWKTFRVSDGTYQPTRGPRRLCH
jgi:hypothetical protein